MTATTNFRLIKSNDFIRAWPTGELDLEESKKVLIDLATLAGRPGDFDILIDIREAGHEEPLTYPEVYQLVAELCRHRAAFRNKIAILTRHDSQFDRASFYEQFATARGFRVAAFTDFEQAIEWLSESANLTPTNKGTGSDYS